MRWKEGQGDKGTGLLALLIEDFVSAHFENIETIALRL
jgi:hypothetical protein